MGAQNGKGRCVQDVTGCQPVGPVESVDEVGEHAHCWYQREELKHPGEGEEEAGEHFGGAEW